MCLDNKENIILYLSLISNDKIYSKLNISHILGFKTIESPSRNPLMKGFIII
jgi:hypothetical protein